MGQTLHYRLGERIHVQNPLTQTHTNTGYSYTSIGTGALGSESSVDGGNINKARNRQFISVLIQRVPGGFI